MAERAVSRWFGDLWTQKLFGDLRIVAAFSSFVIFFGLGVTILATPVGARTSYVLWSIALLTAGGLLGFLFGIPRVLQGTGKSEAHGGTSIGLEAPSVFQPGRKPSGEIDYQQRVNTNLEDISDWLTKIIVGVSLIELRELPVSINALAMKIASSSGLTGSRVESLATAAIIYFSTTGFLYSFLVTRLYVQGALARADLGALERAEREARGKDDSR
jgi:hypothetical protein